MRKQKSVHVKHVTHNGALKERLVYDALDAWYDDLYSYKNGVIAPAVRIVYGSGREYCVTGLHDPVFVVTKIRSQSGLIYIGLDDFDPILIPDEQAFIMIAQEYPDISRSWWDKSLGKAKYVERFWEKVKQHPKTSIYYEDLELAAHCLPTPKLPPGVSKLQYFKFLKRLAK